MKKLIINIPIVDGCIPGNWGVEPKLTGFTNGLRPSKIWKKE